jgi:hypothetical protein
MAKISETKGRSDANSGYARLFGNQQLGQLMSRVHATVIRTGNELEHIIRDETPHNLQTTIEAIIEQKEMFASPIQVVFQGKMPASRSGEKGATADVIVVDHQRRQIKVIELKDGDTFDTKKSSGELESMTKFASWISSVTGYKATYYFCSFNQDDKEAIVKGAKGRFDVVHAMTGRELCALLGIDYDGLRSKRQSQQVDNRRYFLSELLKISELHQLIQELMKKQQE